MVAIRGIMERPGLVNDAQGRFMGVDDDLLDLAYAVFDRRMQLDGCFHGGLGVEFCRKGNLEQDIFHHVRTERARQFYGLASKKNVAKSPLLRRERRGIAHLAYERHESMLHTATGGVPGRP